MADVVFDVGFLGKAKEAVQAQDGLMIEVSKGVFDWEGVLVGGYEVPPLPEPGGRDEVGEEAVGLEVFVMFLELAKPLELFSLNARSGVPLICGRR